MKILPRKILAVKQTAVERLSEIGNSFITLSRSTAQPLNRSAGFTLVEVLVAVMLSVTVLGGAMVSYTAVIRYLQNAKQKTSGAFAAMASMKVMVNELGSADCIVNGECADFDNSAGAGLVNCTVADQLFGRTHDSAGTPRFFRFAWNSGSKEILYCPNATSMVAASPGNCVASELSIAKDIVNAVGEDMFTCDSSNKQVRVFIRAAIEKSPAGVVTQTRAYGTTAQMAFGCDTGC
ncbi:MAG: type II secretion system protein [Elusimicrobiota bacterium]